VNERSIAALRHKNFYRALEGILRSIDEEQGLESMLTTILAKIGDQVLEVETGIRSGRLYKKDGDEYVVVRSFGARGKKILGTRIPTSYPVLAELSHSKVTYFLSDDAAVDQEFESRIGVGNFAAFYLEPDHRYIAAFGIDDQADVAEATLTINALRYAIARRLRETSLEGQLREVRDIQISLLPAEAPVFEGFEIAGHSIPAEEVGGDIFDFLPLGPDLLGVAVGDASGHGLPAALQARDVITGLRMGVEKDFKITAVMRRLNHVIHRSGLTSRFVSLFYGEVERTGNFVYVNAGHDPVLLLRSGGSFEELRSTGIVMGPLADAEYGRQLVHVDPGDTLVLYTDGIVERLDAERDEEFGIERLIASVRRGLEERPIAEVPDAVLEEVRTFGRGSAWQDDVTLVLVHRRS
jgi:sigma-B regulation protein RsbU (phosphoserine phosphatase)